MYPKISSIKGKPHIFSCKCPINKNCRSNVSQFIVSSGIVFLSSAGFYEIIKNFRPPFELDSSVILLQLKLTHQRFLKIGIKKIQFLQGVFHHFSQQICNVFMRS